MARRVNWKQESTYHMSSDPKGYTICKFATADGWLYEAWRGKEMLATRLPTPDAAKAACAESAGYA